MAIKLKVCGMAQAANIAAVAALQPDYLGFIFYSKSPRCIAEISAELIKYVPSPLKTVGVFVNEDVEIVKQKIAKFNLKAVQLHGEENAEYCANVKETGVEIIKAFGVNETFEFEQLSAYLNAVDYFLFDTKTALYGGSGQVFDWKLLTNYQFDKPYFLSGGIDLENVSALQQIKDPRLYAIDINSKFELAPGLKDELKIKEFKKLISSDLI